MKFTFRIMLFCLSFLFILQVSSVFAGSKTKVKVGDKVPNFTLEDAYEKRYELEKMKGKVIILIMGTRKTKENNNRWRQMLQQTFSKNNSIEIFTVADMRIPFFISKSFVREKIKEKIKKGEIPVHFLLDWEQKVNKLLGADKDKTDIFAIDPSGVLVNHQLGAYSDEKFRHLRDKIVEILEFDNLKEKKE